MKRLWRHYPLHIFTLFVFVAIETARFAVEQSYLSTTLTAAFEKSISLAFISNIFLTQSLTGHLNSFNGPSWSISTKFYTYQVFGFILLIKRYVLLTFLLVVIASFWILYSVAPKHPLDGPHFIIFFRCNYLFFLGALCYCVSSFVPVIRSSFLPSVSLVLSLLAIVTIGKSEYKIFIPFLFGATIVLIAKLSVDTIYYQAFSNRFTVWLGAISYSVYLVYGIVWAVLAVAFRFGIGATNEIIDGVRYFNFSPLLSVLVTLASITALLLASHITYRCIEIPLNLSKKSTPA